MNNALSRHIVVVVGSRSEGRKFDSRSGVFLTGVDTDLVSQEKEENYYIRLFSQLKNSNVSNYLLDPANYSCPSGMGNYHVFGHVCVSLCKCKQCKSVSTLDTVYNF